MMMKGLITLVGYSQRQLISSKAHLSLKLIGAKKDKDVRAASRQGYLFSQIFKQIRTARLQVTIKRIA